MTDQWDGTERRKASPVDQVGNKVVEAIHSVANSQPNVLLQNRALTFLVVAVAVGVAMVMIVVIGVFRIASQQGHHHDASRTSQRQLVCLLLTPSEQRSDDALARCGLVDIPGEER